MFTAFSNPVTTQQSDSSRADGPQWRAFDGLRIATISGAATELQLDHQHSHPYTCLYIAGGSALIQQGAGAPLFLEAPALVVLDGAAEAGIELSPDGEAALIAIAQADSAHHASALELGVGRRLDTGSGVASLVGHAIEGLRTTRADISPLLRGRVSHHVVGLIAQACIAQFDDGSSAEAITLLYAAKDYIAKNLGDEDLTPERIATALHISSRTLYRIFAREGRTISAWIRQRRLEACQRDLLDPRSRHLAVSEIGSRWGLWDAAHFSRLFKNTFGHSPKVYRSIHTNHDCAEECASLPLLAEKRMSA